MSGDITISSLVDALRCAYGPRARVKRIHRAGLEGVQLLDGDGRVLLQTFESKRPAKWLRLLMGVD